MEHPYIPGELSELWANLYRNKTIILKTPDVYSWSTDWTTYARYKSELV